MAPSLASQLRAGHGALLARGAGGTLVTVGSTDRYRFCRLLDAVQAVLPLLPRPVVIQHGDQPLSLATARASDVFASPLLTRAAFDRHLDGAELVISHAGAGTLLGALRAGVRVIAMARSPRYGEIADGHQLELAAALGGLGLIDVFEDAAQLRGLLMGDVLRREAARTTLNSASLARTVAAGIASALARGARPRIALVATSGGHMTELRQLRPAYEGYPHFYVATKSFDDASTPERTFVFPSSDRDWRVLRNIPRIAAMLRRERPGIILSTGSGSAIPVITLGRLMGARVIYVESLTRVLRPSFTGRLAYPMSDVFIARWPAVARALEQASLVPVVAGLPDQVASLDMLSRQGLR